MRTAYAYLGLLADQVQAAERERDDQRCRDRPFQGGGRVAQGRGRPSRAEVGWLEAESDDASGRSAHRPSPSSVRPSKWLTSLSRRRCVTLVT